jgi:hypothetical protein
MQHIFSWKIHFLRPVIFVCRLFLMGHSAGAHLSAMMLTVDWENAGLPPSRFAGIAEFQPGCGWSTLEILTTAV